RRKRVARGFMVTERWSILMNRLGRAMMALIIPATMMVGCPYAQPYRSSESGGSTGTPGANDGEGDGMNPCTKDTCGRSGQCSHQNDDSIVPMVSDPCNTYACNNGAVVHNVLLGMPCGMSPLKCNQNGQCAGCTDASQCPMAPCATYTCGTDQICAQHNL